MSACTRSNSVLAQNTYAQRILPSKWATCLQDGTRLLGRAKQKVQRLQEPQLIEGSLINQAWHLLGSYIRLLCRYWFRHATLAWLELPIYALSCRRYKLAAEVVAAELMYGSVVFGMYQWRPVATLWLFLIPYLLSTLAMMFGNW